MSDLPKHPGLIYKKMCKEANIDSFAVLKITQKQHDMFVSGKMKPGTDVWSQLHKKLAKVFPDVDWREMLEIHYQISLFSGYSFGKPHCPPKPLNPSPTEEMWKPYGSAEYRLVSDIVSSLEKEGIPLDEIRVETYTDQGYDDPSSEAVLKRKFLVKNENYSRQMEYHENSLKEYEFKKKVYNKLTKIYGDWLVAFKAAEKESQEKREKQLLATLKKKYEEK